MSFALSMVTRLWRRPRMQLWPLLVRMVQSTVSDFSRCFEPSVKTHASPSAGRANTNRSASKLAPADHIVRSFRLHRARGSARMTYPPELLKALSQVLKRGAIEFLNLDNVPGAYSSDINQRIIDKCATAIFRGHQPRCRLAGDRLACEEGRPWLTPMPAASRRLSEWPANASIRGKC